MHAFIKVMVVSGSLMATAVPALAQTTTGKSRVEGLGGVTFGTETGGFYEGRFTREVTSSLEVIAEGGYMHTVLPTSIGNRLDVSMDAFGVHFDVTAPAFFGAGGVRYLLPATAGVRPYAEGVVGVARVDVKSSFGVEDDNDGLADDTPFENSYNGATKMLAGFGGGVIVPRGRWYVSAGYSYRRLFSLNPASNISRFAAGIGCRF